MKKYSYKKDDISRRVSFKLDISNDESKILIDCFFDVLCEMIVEPKENIHIEIRNFGVFNVIPTKKRKNARNPKTKEIVVIPPRKKVIFKPSKRIKNELYKTRELN